MATISFNRCYSLGHNAGFFCLAGGVLGWIIAWRAATWGGIRAKGPLILISEAADVLFLVTYPDTLDAFVWARCYEMRHSEHVGRRWSFISLGRLRMMGFIMRHKSRCIHIKTQLQTCIYIYMDSGTVLVDGDEGTGTAHCTSHDMHPWATH
jgi:hypothetical protein